MEQRVTSTLLSCNCWNKGSTSAPHLIHRFTNSLLPAPPAVNFWTSSLESFAFPVFTLGVHRRLIAWVAAESFRDRTRPPLRARFFRRSCFMQGEKATHPNIDPKSFYTCKVKKRLWKYRLLACHELFWWNFKYLLYIIIFIYMLYIYTFAGAKGTWFPPPSLLPNPGLRWLPWRLWRLRSDCLGWSRMRLKMELGQGLRWSKGRTIYSMEISAYIGCLGMLISGKVHQ